ncbi:MAG: glucose-6-phosphate isomerase [Arenimonas sp.]
MSSKKKSDAWNSLLAHSRRLKNFHLRDVKQNHERATSLSLRVGPLQASFARQRLDDQALQSLFDLAEYSSVDTAIKDLFNGKLVNQSEQRAALHTSLRGCLVESADALAANELALSSHKKMAELIETLEASDVSDIINIGIGGSDLGPRLAVDALRDFHTGRFRIHFINNVDGSSAQHLLKSLDPSKTAAILVSKTFGTQETLLNGRIIKEWLKDDSRLYAVTANIEKATGFGVDSKNILPMWDWVGGRYSLWSCVGFSLALAIGMPKFSEMLKGATEMDAHFLNSPVSNNLPVWHALIGIWNRNALGFPTQAIMPYDERLSHLPAYLQQLVMESLGKSVGPDNQQAMQATVPVLWGGTGSSSQHSFFQAIHQGSDVVPMDFIGVIKPAHVYLESHQNLLANLFAQAEALANGCAENEPQKNYPGNRPSSLFLLNELNPHNFGMLLALYEHSVYVQSVIWGVNAFDQWGVELGKKLAVGLLPAIADKNTSAGDVITQSLLKLIP